MALARMFQALNPEGQNALNWDLDAPVFTWEGVTLLDNDGVEFVSELDLTNKSIDGALPDAILGLSSLETLKCGNNKLTSLPDGLADSLFLSQLECQSNNLRALPSLPSTLQVLNAGENQLRRLPSLPTSIRQLLVGRNRLRSIPDLSGTVVDSINCENNELVFESLPGLFFNLNDGGEVEYANQKDFGTHDHHLYPDMNDTLRLYPDDTVPLDSNEYLWTKSGDTVGWEREFILDNVSFADSGLYNFQVKNPNYPDLTLSGAIRVIVTDSILFDVNTFIVKYPLDVTHEEVDEQQDTLEAAGWNLIRECWCGGNSAPRLQMYGGDDKTLLDLNTIRAVRKSRISTDTTELNYFLIHNPMVDPSPTIGCDTESMPPMGWQYDVRVALIDSGSDPMHQDLRDWFWQNPTPNNDGNCFSGDVIGWDFPNNTPDIVDEDNHGTHGMGIIRSNYPSDILLQVMNLKVFANGQGLLFDLICALHYAVDQEAEVVNVSLGYYASEPSSLLYEALRRAQDNGVIVAVSAGNEGANVDSLLQNLNRWPGNFKRFSVVDSTTLPLDNIIVVGALTARQDSIAPFSNYGQAVDVAAPGTGIRSTLPGDEYGYLSGTSMSTTFMTRLLSIARAYLPDASYSEIIGCIQQNTSPIAFGDRLAWGGKINEAKTLECLGVIPDDPVSSTDRPEPIRIYPNPFQDVVYIRLGDGNTLYENVTFTVTKMNGGVVYSETCGASELQWDGRDRNGNLAPRGIYFLKIKAGNTRPYIVPVLRL
ncbi:MAG: S8 family serine peptidase [Lewinellaceae bacterium]|nr:S8 family serine peptidase [Phaeodactylibacter sp.]MCB9038670.1 S8 family serine peptidase [Lewinellaceae bacterium]